MKIAEKIAARARANYHEPAVTIAFLGDSVTQGCFGSTLTGDTGPFYDSLNAYHAHLSRIFSLFFPSVPFNIINAGIDGDNAPHALTRVDRDVIAHAPDLTVVCFGLNDCGGGLEKLDAYTAALDGIFSKLNAAGSEIIFMTPNMMCTSVSPLILSDGLKGAAASCAKREEEGVLAAYLEAAKALCIRHGGVVCDCYARWKRLQECGADITGLLCNRINHPSREMHWLFAVSLAETMLGL